MKLLSGLIYTPSTAQRGVDEWIASLADSPASPSPTPADVLAWMTPGTSGPTSHESLTSAGQGGLFSRTSPAICPSASMKSAAIFKAWVSGLRRAYSARRKLALRTGGSGCSSWPTARTSDTNGAGSHGEGGADLRTTASSWPTPRAEERNQYNSADSYVALSNAASTWQTPSVVDAAGRGYTYPSGDRENPFACLPGQAEQWSTPTSRDWKDGADPSANVATNSLLGRQAPRATGEMSAPDSGPRRLNPAFVEWLMGWPLGWTDFAPVETAWCRWWRLMRSELSRLHWLDS